MCKVSGKYAVIKQTTAVFEYSRLFGPAWLGALRIMRFKPFLGYMLFVTIRISLMCQKLDLIETESET